MIDAGTRMPLYIGDYLADTIAPDRAGAWRLRTGPLPNDDRALAAIARTERKVWTAEIGPVVRGFFTAKDRGLHHKRIDAELAKAVQNVSKRTDAAHAR